MNRPSLASYYSHPAHRWYVRCKLRMDPLYPAVMAALATSGEALLDIGGGMGVLAFYLKQHSFAPAIHTTDFDAAKIAVAQRIAARHFPDCTFSAGNAAAGIPPHRGSVTLLDVLQYLTLDQRTALLRECAERIAPGGILVIRSTLRDRCWRYRFSRWVDRMATWTRWIPPAALSHPAAEEVTGVLAAAGLSGKFTPLWGRMPLNNWLGVFRRTAANGPRAQELSGSSLPDRAVPGGAAALRGNAAVPGE
jgi:SAM-dependent methyltransferase